MWWLYSGSGGDSSCGGGGDVDMVVMVMVVVQKGVEEIYGSPPFSLLVFFGTVLNVPYFLDIYNSDGSGGVCLVTLSQIYIYFFQGIYNFVWAAVLSLSRTLNDYPVRCAFSLGIYNFVGNGAVSSQLLIVS